MPYTIHSAEYAPWQTIICGLETSICVGINDHEQKPQRLWVDVEIHGYYPAYPLNISQCLNYDIIHQFVTVDWPKRPQTALLETLAMELFEFIFNKATHASQATIGIYKPDIFKDTQKVGVRLSLTRADFLKLRASKP